MRLSFILGPAGAGKTRACLDGMLEALGNGPTGPVGILLVPEQATFQTELDLALAGDPSPRAHVLSFQRLAVRIFGEVGGAARPKLDELGRRMVLRAILEQRKGDLRQFGRMADKPGFIDLLSRALHECRAHQQGPDALVEALGPLGEAAGSARSGASPHLSSKLHDLAIVMRALEEHLEGRFTDPDLTLALLAARIPQAQLVRGARIWVDGFFGFTPQEYRVLRALIEHADAVHVTLCLDDREGLCDYPESAVFRPTLDTYRHLGEMAVRHGFATDEIRLWGTGVPARFRGAPALALVERNVAEFPGRRAASPVEAEVPLASLLEANVPSAITLVRAPDRRSEMEAIAAEILHLCRDEGYRFRDIAIISRDLDAYHDLAAGSFKALGIPHFLDRRNGVAHHPAVELLRSALEAVGRNWPHDAMFRYLKTDLVPASRSEIDRLENFVLEHGITGRRWLEGAWRFHRRSLEDDDASPPRGLHGEPDEAHLACIEDIRRKSTAALARLADRLAAGRTVRDHCQAIFGLLEDLDVSGTLARWAARGEDEATDARTTEERTGVREHEQVYTGLVDLLDQMVAALGDLPASVRSLASILEAGLSGLQLGRIPPTRDQVLFGSIERSRHPEIRALFIVGAQLGSFPRSVREDPFLDDAEREALAQVGCEIGPSSRTLLFHERYLLYIAATRASTRLYVSYPLTDSQGRGLQPAQLFSQLEGLPGVSLRDLSDRPPREEVLSSPGQLAEAIALNLRAGRTDPWQGLYEWAREHLEPALRPVVSALTPRPLEPPLPRSLAERLLLRISGNHEPAAQPGEDRPRFAMSVSRLESFAACPFQHFSRYGLRLQPRRRYQVDASELGVLAHAALQQYVLAVRDRPELWKDASLRQPGEAADLVAGIAARLARSLKGAILLDSGRNRHLLEQITRMLAEAAFVLGRHDLRSKFRPVGLELSFGTDRDLPALAIALADGAEVLLEGQIDRLDVARRAGLRFVRVIDYKLSTRSFSLGEAALGLSLQLPVYLAVARRHGERWRDPVGAPAAAAAPTSAELLPAGMLYFPVAGKWLDGPVDDEQAEREILKHHKARGLISTEAASLMEEPQGAGSSELLELHWKVDGELSEARSKVADPGQLEALEQHVLGVVRESTERIRAGEIAPDPYRIGPSRTPCTFCDYRAVCRFDPPSGDRPRQLVVPAPAAAWERISGARPAAPHAREALS